MTILATYLTPPADDPLYQLGSSFLGYDIREKRELPHPFASKFSEQSFLSWVERASSFGFHCTVSDALEYEDSDLEKYISKVRAIAANYTPFTLTNFRLTELILNSFTGVFLEFNSQSILTKLASEVVTSVNPLFKTSPYFPEVLEKTSNYNKDYYSKYGAPFVLDLYQAHFTLAGGGIDSLERQKLIELLSESVPFNDSSFSSRIEDLIIVEKQSNGRYIIIETIEL